MCGISESCEILTLPVDAMSKIIRVNDRNMEYVGEYKSLLVELDAFEGVPDEFAQRHYVGVKAGRMLARMLE